MNKDEYEADLLFNKMQNRQALVDEFEKLRPNWKGSVIRFVGLLSGMIFLY